MDQLVSTNKPASQTVADVPHPLCSDSGGLVNLKVPQLSLSSLDTADQSHSPISALSPPHGPESRDFWRRHLQDQDTFGASGRSAAQLLDLIVGGGNPQQIQAHILNAIDTLSGRDLAGMFSLCADYFLRFQGAPRRSDSFLQALSDRGVDQGLIDYISATVRIGNLRRPAR